MRPACRSSSSSCSTARAPDAARALEELLRGGEDFTVVSLTRSFGEAAALMAGFERATGDAIVTLPAYHQIEAAGHSQTGRRAGDSGHRDRPSLAALRQRSSIALRRAASMAWSSSSPGRASAISAAARAPCGGRSWRKSTCTAISIVSSRSWRRGWASASARSRCGSRRRIGSARVYRPREYAHHVLDLFSIFFLVRFTKRAAALLRHARRGDLRHRRALIVAVLSVHRLFFDEQLADRPALLLAALLVVLGMQMFALGLLGELIIFTHARGLKDYRVEEVIQYPDKVAVVRPDESDIRQAEAGPEYRHTADARRAAVV